MVLISDWEDTVEIADWDTLVLGNGASIAIDRRFAYRSLYEVAFDEGMLDPNLRRVFKLLRTRDFERVMELLASAQRVNQILDPNNTKAEASYQALQRALIGAVKSVHPKYEDVRPHLGQISTFMKQFTTVVSLNYDLIVYWAMMHENKSTALRFSDGFLHSQYEEDHHWLQHMPGGGEATLVYYPHGSLTLATDLSSNESKLAAQSSGLLLDTIEKAWNRQGVIPLFVSEGSDDQKRSAIGRSRYLQIVSHSVLPKGCNIVTYGWSLSDNDQHITSRLVSSGDVSHIAVGIHKDGKSKDTLNEECAAIAAAIARSIPKRGSRPSICYFDSSSDTCWIY
jgi:hypothetical protein